MARNVGVNSTFEQQRLVINELAVDVETLENAGYITGYTEQDNLGTVLARGNQATSDILLTGIITATSFVGDGSNLTGISAGAGGTDNVSTSTLSVAGVSTFNGRIIGAATTNVIPFLYANLSDLPSASDYHGAFAHVHATGKAYYAHSGAWVELVNAGVDGTVGTGNENYNIGVITVTSFVGDGSGLTGVIAQGTGIVIQEEGSSVGTAGTINFVGTGVTATIAGGIASVEITSSGGGSGISSVSDDTAPYLGGDLTTNGNDIIFGNNKAIFGSDSGFQIYDNGQGYIENNSGQLRFSSTSTMLFFTTGGEDMARFSPNGSVSLYHDASKKFETTGAGVTVFGTTESQQLVVSGVATATRFESTSAGTPTIDSPNNLNINAVTVAISTDLTVGGNVTASQFVGDGSGLTGVVAQGTGIVIQEEGSSVGTAGTINFIGAGVTATLTNGIASVEITSSGSGITTDNVSTSTLNVTGVATATSFVKSSNSGGFLKADGTEDTNTYLTSLGTAIVDGDFTSNGFMKRTGAGTYAVDSNTYLTTESDPVVGAINGIVKANGSGTISAATAGTDYLAPTGDGSGLTALTGASAGTYGASTNTPVITVDSDGRITGISTVATSGGGGGISNIVEDTTPQLGGNLDLNNNNITGTGDIPAANLTGTLPAIDGSNLTNISYSETDTLATVTSRGNTTTAEITAANFRSNDTTGDGSDVGFALKYYITSNSSSAYRFAGPGVLNTTDNPTLYFHRGFTYILENSTGSGHPFELRVTSGGSAYAPGGNFLTGSINGTQILTVPFDAPNSIVYQCTLHGGMVGTINFVS